MFIYWGRRAYRKKEGVAADFCPICRRPSIVHVVEIRSQPHIYGIGYGQGDLVGRISECTACTSQWPIQMGTVQYAVHPTGPVSLPALIEETFPRFSIAYGERLSQEAIILRDPFSLSERTRMQLIAEPFFVLDNDIAADKNRSTAPKFFGGLFFVLAILTGFGSLGGFVDGSPLTGVICLIIAAGLCWLAILMVMADTKRLMQKSIYPRLASCLAPLRPSSEELTTVMASIKSQCAKQTRLQEFLGILEDARSRTTKTPQAPPIIHEAR